MREHALFLVRNLLVDNPRNRAFVEGLEEQKRFVVDPDGDFRRAS